VEYLESNYDLIWTSNYSAPNVGPIYGTTNYDVTDTHIFTSDLGNYLYEEGIGNPSGGWTHTFSFWMYIDSADWSESHQGYVYALRSSSNIDQQLVGDENASQSGLLLKRYGDKLRYLVSFGTRAHQTPGDASVNGFNIDAWSHIAVVCDGGQNTVTIYENAVEKAWVHPTESAYTTNSDLWNLEANSHLMVGKDPRDKLPFIGKISNFKLFDEALDLEQIQTIHNSGRIYVST
jgi:hypothetical protein